jgi:hypothetical protein
MGMLGCWRPGGRTRELRDDEPCNGEGKSHQKGGSQTLLLVFHMSSEEGATLPTTLKIEMSARRDRDGKPGWVTF